MAAGTRSPEEIRRSIESAREELAESVHDLQLKVERLRRALIVAAAAGFVVGAVAAGTLALLRRRR